MNSFFEESMFAGVTLSIIAYLIGAILKKKFKLGIFNPLLIAIIAVIAVLCLLWYLLFFWQWEILIMKFITRVQSS